MYECIVQSCKEAIACFVSVLTSEYFTAAKLNRQLHMYTPNVLSHCMICNPYMNNMHTSMLNMGAVVNSVSYSWVINTQQWLAAALSGSTRLEEEDTSCLGVCKHLPACFSEKRFRSVLLVCLRKVGFLKMLPDYLGCRDRVICMDRVRRVTNWR